MTAWTLQYIEKENDTLRAKEFNEVNEALDYAYCNEVEDKIEVLELIDPNKKTYMDREMLREHYQKFM